MKCGRYMRIIRAVVTDSYPAIYMFAAAAMAYDTSPVSWHAPFEDLAYFPIDFHQIIIIN